MSGFVNVGAVVGSGVYVLYYQRRVIWVGKAKSILAKLYAHLAKRSGNGLPAVSMFHQMDFDDVDVWHCRVDQLEEIFAEVCLQVDWHAPAGASVSQLVNAKRAAREAVSSLRRRA